MSKSLELARTAIKGFIGKTVVIDLERARSEKLFQHEPGTFRLRFADPKELQSFMQDEYGDYVHKWNFDASVPVAAVSSAESASYEFGFLFLDWSKGADGPRVLATTTDRWKVDDRYAVSSLAELGLKIA